MKRVLLFALFIAFSFAVLLNAQVKPPVKKFELNKSTGSTKATTVAEKKAVTPETTKSSSTAKVTTAEPTQSKAITTAAVKPAASTLPPLPAGQKRVDVNVIQEEYFVCPKDNKEFKKAGKCPTHSVVLEKRLRSYTYKCKLCGYTSEKEGKCPSCKGNPPLRKFEVTYQDVTCKFVGSEPGKCPTCQQDLKKVSLVELKK